MYVRGRNDYSIAEQLRRLRQYAQEHRYSVVATYADAWEVQNDNKLLLEHMLKEG